MPEQPEANARDCKHGHLARSCEICELEAENKRLREELLWLMDVVAAEDAESIAAILGTESEAAR